MAQSMIFVSITVLLLSSCLVFAFSNTSSQMPTPRAPIAPACIVFGDSTVDVGMNNRLNTVVKSNFLPYGRDFINNKPTGRFSNGQLAIDVIATKLGLPRFPPAYLDPEANGENIIYGVNFASSASGYNENTSKIFNVYSLSKQMQLFEQYQTQLADVVGASRASYILSEALYIISTGNNDYVNNYFLNIGLKSRLNKEEYRNFLLQQASSVIQQLISMGAKRIGVVSLPPFGCLPSQITLYGRGKRECIQWLNDVAADFNERLESEIGRLKMMFNGIKLAYLDSYSILLDTIQNPTKYGLEVAHTACCGTGDLEVSILCNRASPGTCEDASKYVFWDSYHPSQTAYEVLGEYLFRLGYPQLT